MNDVTIPYALAVALAVIMLAWMRNPTSSRTVLWILLWDGALLFGVLAWYRAARDSWWPWAINVTWALWFVVGVGAIVWLVLAMRMAEDGPPPPPAKTNYVANYPASGRAKYQYKGKRRK